MCLIVRQLFAQHLLGNIYRKKGHLTADVAQGCLPLILDLFAGLLHHIGGLGLCIFLSLGEDLASGLGRILEYAGLLLTGLRYQLFLLLGQLRHAHASLFGEPERLVDVGVALVHHACYGREAPLGKYEEHYAEDEGHPEQQAAIRSNQVHGLLEHYGQQADNDAEQGCTLDHTGDYDHAGTDVSGGFGLAGDGLHCGCADLSDSITCSKGCESCCDCCTGLSDGRTSYCLKNNCEYHNVIDLKLLFALCPRHANVDGREHCKYICLDKGDKHLQYIQEDSEE